MGCVKLHILDEQYKRTELKVSYINKKLTPNFCAENLRSGMLINMIDPDGREVFISGTLSDEALKQLQERMKGITLSIGENGKLGYTMNEGVEKLKGEDKMLAGIIDNASITVNLITTDKNVNSKGGLLVGGAFMGNTVTKDAEGNVTNITANQEVNPRVLGLMSKTNLNRGADMLHETTEAYEGAKISQESGISSPASNQPGSVWPQAHNRATPQSGRVYETLYAPYGKETNNPKNAVRVIYSTSPYLAPYGVKKPKGLVNIVNYP